MTAFSAPTIGFSTNVYDNPADIVGHLGFLAQHFDDIEMEIAEEAQDVLFRAGPHQYEHIVTGVRDVVAAHDLGLSVHAAWFGPHTDLCADDDAERQASVVLLGRAIRFAADVGVSHVTYHPGYRNGKSNAQLIETLQRSLAQISGLTSELGVTLCLENMGASRPRFVVFTPEEHVSLCAGTGTALTLDVVHLASVYQDRSAFHDALQAVVPYVRIAHVADMPGQKHAHLPLGVGDFDLNYVLDVMGSMGFRGAAIVEEFVRKYPPELYLERALSFRDEWDAAHAPAAVR
jgi:sugar phosphate isomerase/epimerase